MLTKEIFLLFETCVSFDIIEDENKALQPYKVGEDLYKTIESKSSPRKIIQRPGFENLNLCIAKKSLFFNELEKNKKCSNNFDFSDKSIVDNDTDCTTCTPYELHNFNESCDGDFIKEHSPNLKFPCQECNAIGKNICSHYFDKIEEASKEEQKQMIADSKFFHEDQNHNIHSSPMSEFKLCFNRASLFKKFGIENKELSFDDLIALRKNLHKK